MAWAASFCSPAACIRSVPDAGGMAATSRSPTSSNGRRSSGVFGTSEAQRGAPEPDEQRARVRQRRAGLLHLGAVLRPGCAPRPPPRRSRRRRRAPSKPGRRSTATRMPSTPSSMPSRQSRGSSGQAVRVPRVPARERRQHERRVPHGPRDRPGDGDAAERAERPLRHPAEGRLQPDHAAPGGRDADAAARIGADMQRPEPGRRRGRSAGGGAAGRMRRVARIAGDAVQRAVARATSSRTRWWSSCR